MKTGEGSYFVCGECTQQPAYRSQEKLDMHRESFHEIPKSCKSTTSSLPRVESRRRVCGGKKSRKLSELISSRDDLQKQLDETKEHVSQLETASGEQEYTITLVKREMESMKKAFDAKNTEIERLQRIQTSIIRIEGKPTMKTTTKASRTEIESEEKSDLKKSMNAEYLSLMDSMKTVTGLDFDDSESTASQDIRECDEYKTTQICSLENQIERLTSEINEMKQNHGTLKTRLIREAAIKEDIKRMFQDAQSKYKEKDLEVQECRKQICVLEKQIREDRRVIDRLTSELEVFQQKYNEFKDRANESQSMVEKLHKEISKSLECQSHKQLKNDELQMEIDGFRGKMEEKEKNIQLMIQSEKILKLKINRLTMDLEDIKTQEQSEEFKLNQIRLQFEGRVESLEMEKDMMNTANVKLRENLRVAGNEEDAMKTKIRALEKERGCISRERNNLKRELDKSKRQFIEMDKHFQRMKKSNKDWCEAKKKIQLDKSNLQKELKTTKEELEKLKNNHQESKKVERTKIFSELEVRKSNLDEIRKDLNKATTHQAREEERLRCQMEHLQNKVKDREVMMEKMKKESENVQNTLFQTIHDLREKCQISDEKVSHNLELEVEHFKTSLDEAKRVICEQTKKFDKLKELHLKLDTELIRVSNIKFDLEKERDLFKKQFEQVSKENDHISKELSKMELCLKESEKTTENKNQQTMLSKQLEESEKLHQEKIRAMERDITKQLKETERSYEDKIRDMQHDIEKKMERAEKLHRDKIGELKKAEKSHKKKIDEMQQDIARKQKDFKRSEEELSIEHTKNEELENQLKQCQLKIEDLTKQIETHRCEGNEGGTELHSDLEFHREQVKKLNQDLKVSGEKQNQIKEDGEAKLKEIVESKQVLEKEKQNLSTSLIHSEATQVSLSNQIEELNSKLLSMQRFKKDFEKAQNEKVKLENNLENAQSEKSKLENKIKEIEKKGGTNNASSTNEINKLRER